MTGRLHVHGEQVVDRLHFEACLVEFTQGGRYVLKATGGGHGWSLTQFHGADFAVASDAEMGFQAFYCGFGFVLERRWDGAGAKGLSRSESCGLQFKFDCTGSVGDELDCCWDVSRFDPNVPVIKIGPELCVTVKSASAAAANPHGESGHPWSIPLLAWMCAYEPSWCLRCIKEPVYQREKTVASYIMERLETFWKVALRSRATRTRVVSASAKYWMDLIILFAPSWHPTPC